jgi:hypothetical protein
MYLLRSCGFWKFQNLLFHSIPFHHLPDISVARMLIVDGQEIPVQFEKLHAEMAHD